MLSFFPRGVLDEILNLIESVSEDFPSYPYIYFLLPYFKYSACFVRIKLRLHELYPYNIWFCLVLSSLALWSSSVDHRTGINIFVDISFYAT